MLHQFRKVNILRKRGLLLYVSPLVIAKRVKMGSSINYASKINLTCQKPHTYEPTNDMATFLVDISSCFIQRGIIFVEKNKILNFALTPDA